MANRKRGWEASGVNLRRAICRSERAVAVAWSECRSGYKWIFSCEPPLQNLMDCECYCWRCLELELSPPNRTSRCQEQVGV